MATTEILLVEDNPGDVLLLSEALDRSGWDCHLTVLRNGADALAYLFRREKHAQAIRPHLILLDLNLPLVSGYEVLEEVKKDAGLASIPLALLSGSASEPARGSCLSADRCFIKPMVFLGYVSMVERLQALTGSPDLQES